MHEPPRSDPLHVLHKPRKDLIMNQASVKKFILFALAFFAIISVLIVGNLVEGGRPPAEANATFSYDGAWKSTGDLDFVATIKGDSISIYWVMDPDTTGLYWQGTFPAGARTTISTADLTAMSKSMYSSSEKEKVFTYKAGTLSFHFSAMGVKRVITLRK